MLFLWTQKGAPLEKAARTSHVINGSNSGRLSTAPQACLSPGRWPLTRKGRPCELGVPWPWIAAGCRSPRPPSAGWEPPVEGGRAEAWMRCTRGDGQGSHCSSDSKLGLKSDEEWRPQLHLLPGVSTSPWLLCASGPVHTGQSHSLPRGAAEGRTGVRNVWHVEGVQCASAVVVGH